MDHASYYLQYFPRAEFENISSNPFTNVTNYLKKEEKRNRLIKKKKEII